MTRLPFPVVRFRIPTWQHTPLFSGTEDFDRPAREWDRNTMLREQNGTTPSGWSSFSSGRSNMAAAPGGEARKTERGSGLFDSISTLSLRDV